MIPTNTLTTAAIYAPYGPPEDAPYDPFRHVVRGGVALGDPSQGRNSQNWEVTYSAGTIWVGRVGQASVFSLVVAGVLSVSLAFDNNMQVAVGYMNSSGANLYYFNSLSSSYQTFTVSGATSCKVCVDDNRGFADATSDVIFAYTLAGVLYWTQQRDRYATPRVVGNTVRRLERLGLSKGARLQFGLN